MTDNSTPRPWRVARRMGAPIIKGESVDPRSDVASVNIPFFVRGRKGLTEREANAALIVRAVNAHDELVAAIQTILDAAGQLEGRNPTRLGFAILQARAALAKAKA